MMRRSTMTPAEMRRLLKGVERVEHEGGIVEYRWGQGGTSSVLIQSRSNVDHLAAEWRRDTLRIKGAGNGAG